MKVTLPRRRLPDLALLGPLQIVTVIGSLQLSLLVIDGAGSITAAPGPAPNFAPTVQPAPVQRPMQVVFKWSAAPDHVRDIINPYYGSERTSFAFYSFFRSNRRAVLFKPLDKRREWVPYDGIDIRMLRFICEQNCV